MSDCDDVLEIKELEVAYSTNRGDVKAVGGHRPDVRRGEILGIAGESGSGKSTLAVALLRLLKPPGKVTGGAVMFPGRAVAGGPAQGRGRASSGCCGGGALAYLPQGSMNSLNPVMRIEDQFRDVILSTRRARTRLAAELIPRLLGQVGLEPRVARMYPHELSGGMKQRVLIAIAVALEPDLVIADEPTTALDVTIQRVIRRRWPICAPTSASR